MIINIKKLIIVSIKRRSTEIILTLAGGTQLMELFLQPPMATSFLLFVLCWQVNENSQAEYYKCHTEIKYEQTQGPINVAVGMYPFFKAVKQGGGIIKGQ
ncbi:hypothetical protein XENOCAPTIV_011718 [Xenoophorus captivus]|uniref:Uncharacterized protein n=1 Tax=Xenoophorus captivus TaxID=1517983 RepID=A0ABV0RGW4_9TELE